MEVSSRCRGKIDSPRERAVSTRDRAVILHFFGTSESTLPLGENVRLMKIREAWVERVPKGRARERKRM